MHGQDPAPPTSSGGQTCRPRSPPPDRAQSAQNRPPFPPILRSTLPVHLSFLPSIRFRDYCSPSCHSYACLGIECAALVGWPHCVTDRPLRRPFVCLLASLPHLPFALLFSASSPGLPPSPASSPWPAALPCLLTRACLPSLPPHLGLPPSPASPAGLNSLLSRFLGRKEPDHPGE